MSGSVIVWDLETVFDLKGFAAANDLVGKTDEELRTAHGDRFPKHLYHSIICIGAVVAERTEGLWHVKASGAPHIGERSERELIETFVGKIAELQPQLVTFNGAGFDLPVLRYRAMLHGVAAPGLSARPYFNRFTDDAIDLCDVLSSFRSPARATLHEICRVMGLPGKTGDLDGSGVASLFAQGRIKDISDYCETDVVNTYRLWLRYDLFRGRLTPAQFAGSEADLDMHIRERLSVKPHLGAFVSNIEPKTG